MTVRYEAHTKLLLTVTKAARPPKQLCVSPSVKMDLHIPEFQLSMACTDEKMELYCLGLVQDIMVPRIDNPNDSFSPI